MHASTRKIMNRLVTYCARSPQLDEALIRIRRLLVLSCVLVKKHVRVEKSFYFEERCGLVTQQELKAMTKTIMLEASMPAGDGRKTTYPARNWPAVAFYHVQRELVKIFRDGHLPSSPHAACRWQTSADKARGPSSPTASHHCREWCASPQMNM